MILNAHFQSSEPVLMRLLYAISVPLLTYACEAIPHSAKQLNEMTVVLNDAIRRIFSFHRWESVRALRQTLGYMSITEIVHQRTTTFYSLFAKTDNNVLLTLKSLADD